MHADLKLTPGPWMWWTSCSYRRLSSKATGRDGDVLTAVVQRSDGHPDENSAEKIRNRSAAMTPPPADSRNYPVPADSRKGTP